MQHSTPLRIAATLAATIALLAPGTARAACPCTIWPDTATPVTASTVDNSAVELGLKFRSDDAGFIKGLRFYKGSLNTGAHLGTLWTRTGTLLAQAPFTDETASGWQTLTFATPVAITANTTYVASYHTTSGYYASNNDFFATAGVDAPPLHALAEGVDGSNGVYLYGGGGFPIFSYRSTNYWVDVVFDHTFGDSTPPVLTGRAPAPGATGISAGVAPVATFSEPIDPATLAMTLTGPGGPVAGSTSYQGSSRTATFTPYDRLDYTTSYTVAVSGARDTAGNTMAPDSWSFTTGAAPPPPTDPGPGGPILLVTSASDRPVSSFYTEILRTEGLNEFEVIDVSQLSGTTLAAKDVVVLAEVVLASGQVTALTNFVTGGGSVLAMRPDPKLASLLGLTRQTGTEADGYLAVNPSEAATAGITAETMQYHGTADRYSLNGATALATLYSSATAATSYPAVTRRSVGSAGGEAAAFTFDLARSVIFTRQGNPLWAGQSRDGLFPIRSHELYYGGSLSDWVNLSKVSIPQADEQQRLLANLILTTARSRKPLPRFWYFPRALKAAIVATGDDHAGGGTAGRFDQYLAASPVGCTVAAWTCPRFTSYIYRATPLSNSRALNYHNRGFEIALHPDTGCSDFTPASLQQTFSTQLAQFKTKYTSLPAPSTNRTHCLVWSDWSTEPKVERANNIRLDTTYYFWPGAWVADRPGYMTGSGMPMRFTDVDGSLLDVYQAATAMTDESDQSYPFTPDTLLDNALGPKGYTAAITANLHTDSAQTFENDEVMASARARGVPIVSARQLMTWLDGRNASSFKSIGYSSGTLTFSVSAGANTTGLTAMVPTESADGLLSSLTRDGTAVNYSVQTIKGLEYAVFQTAAGTYSARYAAPPALAVSAMETMTSDEGTTLVTWKTTSPATTEVAWGYSPSNLDQRVRVGEATREHRLDLPRLTAGQLYWFRITSRDQRGREVTYPAAGLPALGYRIPDWLGRAPEISGVRAVALPDGTATIRWATDVRSDGAVELGTSADSLERRPVGSGFGLRHSVSLSGLQPGRRYTYRVRSATPWGVGTSSALLSVDVPAYGVADSRLAEWLMGERTASASLAPAGDGALRLTDSGTTWAFTSRVLDAEQMVAWRNVGADFNVSAGATLRAQVRTGSTLPPGNAEWSPWIDVTGNGAALAGARDSRFLQYRLRVAGGAAVVRAVGVTTTGRTPDHPNEGNG